MLKAAGVEEGWEAVYLVKTYHTKLDETMEKFVEVLKGRMGGKRPVWTCVEVQRLAVEGMAIEIEVEAYKEESVEA